MFYVPAGGVSAALGLETLGEQSQTARTQDCHTEPDCCR